MKHAVCRELYDYWNRLRGRLPAPQRDAIEPADIRRILGDTFILEKASPTAYRYRLAGTRLCGAYGREMKGLSFLDFWGKADREPVETLLAAITDDAAAAVIGVTAHASRERALSFEMLLLPLASRGPGFERVLGGMAPMDHPFWLGMDPIVRQEIVSLRLIWPDETPRFLRRPEPEPDVPTVVPLRPPLSPKALRERFVLLDGGKR